MNAESVRQAKSAVSFDTSPVTETVRANNWKY